MANLKEILKEFKGKEVSIGTASGTNYLYIGPADDVDLIKKVFADHHDEIANKKFPKKKDELISAMKGIRKNDDLVKQAKEIAKLVTTYERYETYLAEYVEPMKRKVVEVFDSDVGEPTRVILTGNETGECWFKSEFDLKHRNK